MREAIIKWWPPEFGSTPETEHFTDRKLFTELMLRAMEGSHSVMSTYQFDPTAPIGTQLMTPIQRSMSAKNRMLQELWHEHMKDAPLGKSIASLFEIVAEEFLIQPTIIYDFPLAVSPLSKVKPDEPEWVERFEFYIGGFEVGNAFSELNDPEDQRRRFEQQLEQKERGDAEAHQMDEDYVRALGYGLPPTAGEGIGIDRLTMLLTNSRSIRDVILFPLMRPIAKQQPADQPHGESAE
jgi:lysyl-tRNA synthetase class 2